MALTREHRRVVAALMRYGGHAKMLRITLGRPSAKKTAEHWFSVPAPWVPNTPGVSLIVFAHSFGPRWWQVLSFRVELLRNPPPVGGDIVVGTLANPESVRQVRQWVTMVSALRADP